jgi:DNA polymerase-3 subunit epsilon
MHDSAQGMTDLESLDVLVVDCQATAAHPRGQLLEVGWARARVHETPGEIEAHVVAPVLRLRLAPRVERLTGLTPRDLRRGRSPEEVAARLASVVAAIPAHGPTRARVAVAHFGRFEAPFVADLLRARPELTLSWVCTHAIARRLLPALPRRGLRALAGYLGEDVPELRRAAHHVCATVRVWRELVPLLAREHGIHTLEELVAWCAAPPPRGGRVFPMDPGVRRRLPDAPGVYRFRRAGGSVLYVGKAKSLRHRVGSYFQPSRPHEERTLEMLAQARDVDFTPSGSALEAALLEADEIKRLEPPYNVALRERQRRLGYWTRSLRHVSPQPDARHPVGPMLLLPNRQPPLTALLELVESRGAPGAVQRLRAPVLGVPSRYAPSSSCFRAGLCQFVRRHRLWKDSRGTAKALLRLARRRSRIQVRPAEAEAGDQPLGSHGEAGAERARPSALPAEREDTVEAARASASWTPESVAEALDEVVRRGALAVRRARWLCALSESSMAWSAEDAEALDGSRTCLVLSGAAVVERRTLAAGEELPAPPGHATARVDRQRSIDLAAYDRLSTLSRELKRLVVEDGQVALCLGPERCLDRAALAKALRWL